MKILITGGAGYIGSVLSGMLLDRGYNVTIIDKFIFNQNSLGHIAHNKKLNIIKGDANKASDIKKLIKENDVIVPLAGYVGAPICKKYPRLSTEANKGSIQLLKKYLSPGQFVIYPNSNSGYGTTNPDKFCDESTPLNPISLYGKDKKIAEDILMERENSTVFRLATVFGTSPRMRVDLLVNDFTLKAAKFNKITIFEKTFVRNYIHVRDVSRAFMYAMENKKKFQNEIFNHGLSNANLTKLELCHKIKRVIKSFKIVCNDYKKDIDKRNYRVSNKKLERTGFKNVYSLEDGIRELVQFYKIYKVENSSNI
jgi:nucleoside-diphosphate-sugar epimerase